MINEKISIYISLYHDLDFLEDILININENIDEIIFVDGPYEYCLSLLQNLNLFYDEHNKPSKLTTIINKYSHKLKYYYKIWKNEKEKRMFGYDMCSNDLVLLVDCDEFVILKENIINDFISSDKIVAGFKIFNMNRINININQYNIKNILFKKKFITSYQHLSYTWLIGVNDLEKLDIQNIYTKKFMGLIYHQTLNRTKINNIIKFIFYTRLYYYNNDISKINLIFNYDLDFILNKIKIEDVINIFYHSSMELIGIPENKILYKNNDVKLIGILENKILYKNNDVKLNLDKYKNNHRDAYFIKDTTILKNVNYSCYIDLFNNNNNIKFLFDNIKDVKITIYEICLDKEYDNHINIVNNIQNNEVFINLKLKNNIDKCISYVICINVLNTINDDIVCKINNIELLDNFTYKIQNNTLNTELINNFTHKISYKSISFNNQLYDEIIPLGEEYNTSIIINGKFEGIKNVRNVSFPFDHVGHVFIDKINKKIKNFEYLKREDISIKNFNPKHFLIDNKFGFKYWHDLYHENENDFTEEEINSFINKYNKRYKRFMSYLNSGNKLLFISICNYNYVHKNKYKKKSKLVDLYKTLLHFNKNITLLAFNYCKDSFEENTLIHINIPFNKTEKFEKSKKNFEIEIYNYVKKCKLQVL
jgi:hypothetical protein